MASRIIDILIPPGKVRERIDVYLTNHVENATRTKVQQAIKEGLVLVDGKPVRSSHKVAPGERIHITLPKADVPDVTAEEIALEIVHEDAELLVVNKPAGMVTHPAYGNYTGTLVNALLHHCNAGLSTLNDPTRPGIVHRLDKETSGLMVVAKNDVVHAKLAKQFEARDAMLRGGEVDAFLLAGDQLARAVACRECLGFVELVRVQRAVGEHAHEMRLDFEHAARDVEELLAFGREHAHGARFQRREQRCVARRDADLARARRREHALRFAGKDGAFGADDLDVNAGHGVLLLILLGFLDGLFDAADHVERLLWQMIVFAATPGSDCSSHSAYVSGPGHDR